MKERLFCYPLHVLAERFCCVGMCYMSKLIPVTYSFTTDVLRYKRDGTSETKGMIT